MIPTHVGLSLSTSVESTTTMATSTHANVYPPRVVNCFGELSKTEVASYIGYIHAVTTSFACDLAISPTRESWVLTLSHSHLPMLIINVGSAFVGSKAPHTMCPSPHLHFLPPPYVLNHDHKPMTANSCPSNMLPSCDEERYHRARRATISLPPPFLNAMLDIRLRLALGHPDADKLPS